MPDPDPADVAADDQLLEDLRAGAAPENADPLRWELTAARDRARDIREGR